MNITRILGSNSSQTAATGVHTQVHAHTPTNAVSLRERESDGGHPNAQKTLPPPHPLKFCVQYVK